MPSVPAVARPADTVVGQAGGNRVQKTIWGRFWLIKNGTLPLPLQLRYNLIRKSYYRQESYYEMGFH